MYTLAIIPSKGLGDLCVTLGLAYNLSKSYHVCVYHPLMSSLSCNFPFIEARTRDKCKLIPEDPSLKACILIYEDSLFFQEIKDHLHSTLGDKLYILNPVVTAKKDYLYSDVYFFNHKLSFSSNLLHFAKTRFFENFEDKTAGFRPKLEKAPNLIVFHTTSSKASKSWPASYFIRLKKQLEKRGYEVKFAALPHEIEAIKQGLYSGLKNLEELATLIQTATLVVANESGVAHLASALHTPSYVISRNPRIQAFWGADYEGKAHALFASAWIPNLKGLRLRDKFWKYFIFPKRVLKGILSRA